MLLDNGTCQDWCTSPVRHYRQLKNSGWNSTLSESVNILHASTFLCVPPVWGAPTGPHGTCKGLETGMGLGITILGEVEMVLVPQEKVPGCSAGGGGGSV